MGILRRERFTPDQLMPRYIKQLFTRKYGTEGRSLDLDRHLLTVKWHACYVVTQDDPPQSSAEQLSKVATMRQGGDSAKMEVETLISNLESR